MKYPNPCQPILTQDPDYWFYVDAVYAAISRLTHAEAMMARRDDYVDREVAEMREDLPGIMANAELDRTEWNRVNVLVTYLGKK